MSKKNFMAEDIIGKIYQNRYKSWEQLPTERELAKIYGVSRDTVRRALKKLVDLNFVESIQGKGTFIKEGLAGSSLIYNSLVEKKFREISSEVLEFTEIKAGKEFSKIFDTSADDTLFQYKRIRIVDFVKVQIELTRVPKNLFPNLKRDDIKDSFHSYVIRSGYDISHFITTYSAINLSREDAELLNLKKGKAVMMIKNRGILSNSQVFEYSELVTDEYSCSYISNFNSNLLKYRNLKAERK